MWRFPVIYDVIVVGAGHAGCEAAYVAARRGARTLMLTMNLDTIAKMSCNPAIGGVGKGHIVREIDALGGIMGKITDRTAIQFRMLNASRGPAVWAPRAQADKAAYQLEMKRVLELLPNLEIKQGTTEGLWIEDDRICGVHTLEGITYQGKTVVLSAGTFMRGLLHLGQTQYSGGRAGDKPSVGLSADLEALGFRLGRLKTGTPPRIHSSSIDYSSCELQPGEDGVCFSFDAPEPRLPQVPCHITYTTAQTKEIVNKNLHRSAMYSGAIRGVGPRYCPSIEDKFVRFADKERHQVFLEPEGLNTQEVYVNGISTSLPVDVQHDLIRSIVGLENAQIMRLAYAIEYDYLISGQVDYTLESRTVKGLFFAGQINGTTGYEEAAGQGLIAGINAVNRAFNQSAFILSRNESYIGVMIDDLINKGLGEEFGCQEPYRMFTSRAENRLMLLQGNADLRLRKYGYELGLIDQQPYEALVKKQACIEHECQRLQKVFVQINGKGYSLAQLLARPESSYAELQAQYPEKLDPLPQDVTQHIEWNLRYAGYIKRQEIEIQKLEQIDTIEIPEDFSYASIKALCREAREKLSRIRPRTLGQASRISGISPADLSILMVTLRRTCTHST